MMKNSVRLLLLSCVMATAFSPQAVQAQTQMQTQPISATPTAAATPGEAINALNSANAAAVYAGNPALAQQAAQPGQAMIPNGMQMGPFQPEEPPPTLRYNKKKAEGAFYGVDLPQRLFNNVPSHW